MQAAIPNSFAHLLEISCDVYGSHTPQDFVSNGVAAKPCQKLRARRRDQERLVKGRDICAVKIEVSAIVGERIQLAVEVCYMTP
jgi:hypothetical protein